VQFPLGGKTKPILKSKEHPAQEHPRKDQDRTRNQKAQSVWKGSKGRDNHDDLLEQVAFQSK